MDGLFQRLAVIILAAGLGKRMKSSRPKVLHELLEKPMVSYVVDTAVRLADRNVYVVVGYQADQVQDAINKDHEVHYVFQKQQLGTGHAVSCALPFLESHIQYIVVLCGDTPLITPSTLTALIQNHLSLNNDITILAARMDCPTGYGRILFNDNQMVTGIVEEPDATDEQRKITIVNTGIYCISREFLADAVGCLTMNNVQNELYFTDIVGIGYRKDKSVGAVIAEDARETIGVNSPEDLRVAELEMNQRLSKKLDFHYSP